MNFEIDYSLTTFTSEGKLEQCEHALVAAQNGNLSIGICSPDGVVLSSLKILPKLVEKEKVYKVSQVCSSIGITYAGMQPDFRIIYEKACILAEGYKDVYGRYPYIDVFVNNLSRVLQEYTQKGGLRPFGVALTIAGYIKINNELVPRLYSMEPSGGFKKCNVCAIGKENENAVKYASSKIEMLDDNLVCSVNALRDYAGCSIGFEDVDIGILKNGCFEIFKRSSVKEIFDSYVRK
ncbi:Proteasome subunit alpha type-2 [Gurleya vavrai]